MKIGLCTVGIPRGRSRHYAPALLHALVEAGAGHEFVVYALDQDAALFQGVGRAVQLVRVGDGPAAGLRNVAWHHLVLPQLARRDRLDVLHVIGLRIPVSHPCGTAVTVPDLAMLRRRSYGHRLATGLFRALFAWAVRRADQLVATSAGTAADLVGALRVPAIRVTTVPNGVDHARFARGSREEAAAVIARRHGVHPPFFLSVAEVQGAPDNHVRLVTAFNQFKMATPSPWQLVIIGDHGPGAEAAERSPYGPDIHCLDEIAAAQLSSWYRAAGALVQPGLADGFALAGSEAMACGCPVLAAAGGATAEVCGAAAIEANPEDTAAMRRQLARLAFDPDLRARLASAGRAVAAQCDWSTAAASMIDVYARAARRALPTLLAGPRVQTPSF